MAQDQPDEALPSTTWVRRPGRRRGVMQLCGVTWICWVVFGWTAGAIDPAERVEELLDKVTHPTFGEFPAGPWLRDEVQQSDFRAPILRSEIVPCALLPMRGISSGHNRSTTTITTFPLTPVDGVACCTGARKLDSSADCSLLMSSTGPSGYLAMIEPMAWMNTSLMQEAISNLTWWYASFGMSLRRVAEACVAGIDCWLCQNLRRDCCTNRPCLCAGEVQRLVRPVEVL